MSASSEDRPGKIGIKKGNNRRLKNIASKKKTLVN